MLGQSLYRQKSHYLNKMGIKELNAAYFLHYTVVTYIVLQIAAFGAALYMMADWRELLLSAMVTIAMFPMWWYITHRWVMHNTFLYKNKWTSSFWKRIHYDHHMDPHHLEVLFGALYTTLPSVFLTTAPFGYLIGDVSGALMAYGIGLFMTCVYEYIHCIQHLNFKPKNRWLMELKTHHMMHHFHDEDGNFGITNFTIDKILNSFYERKERKTRSAFVNNLGYDEEEAAKYPWVAELSGGVDNRSIREKRAEAKATKADSTNSVSTVEEVKPAAE